MPLQFETSKSLDVRYSTECNCIEVTIEAWRILHKAASIEATLKTYAELEKPVRLYDILNLAFKEQATNRYNIFYMNEQVEYNESFKLTHFSKVVVSNTSIFLFLLDKNYEVTL